MNTPSRPVEKERLERSNKSRELKERSKEQKKKGTQHDWPGTGREDREVGEFKQHESQQRPKGGLPGRSAEGSAVKRSRSKAKT